MTTSKDKNPVAIERISHGQWSQHQVSALRVYRAGAIQAANVVNSSRAIQMSIYVVRAFVQLRSVLASNRDIAQKLAELGRRVDSHDGAIVGILKTIRELMNLPERQSRPIGFVPLEEKKRKTGTRCHFQDHNCDLESSNLSHSP